MGKLDFIKDCCSGGWRMIDFIVTKVGVNLSSGAIEKYKRALGERLMIEIKQSEFDSWHLSK